MALIDCQRERFGIPEDVVYFNCAYLSPLLKEVGEAGHLAVERKARPWLVTPPDFFEESHQVRTLFAQLLGAGPADIAILPSVSYGIGVAAKNIPLARGQRVLVLAEQFPSNVYPWLELIRTSQAELLTVHRPADDNWTAAVLDHLDERVGIVALPHCHWTDGSLVDLVEIGQRCRQMSIPLVVDATQSLGVMPFDLAAIQPAFVVAATYKWLLGPYSGALMYVAPPYQNGDPLEYNWITRHGSENFAGLVRYTDQLAEGAVKYDVGERSNFALLPMVRAALSTILSWGVPNIAETLRTFNQKLSTGARELGFRTVAPEYAAPHLIGLRFAGQLPASLAGALRERNIHVSVRGDAIRIAPHLFNHAGDRDHFLKALSEIMA